MAYIGNSPVQDETVTSAQIVDGAILNEDVNSSAAIAFSKMANLTASRVLVSDGSGDVSVSNVTSAETLILDGGTSATSTTLAAADRVIVNDNGTMVQVALSDFETFFEGAIDTLSSAMTFSSTVTVGSDGSGQDVIFYSGTSGDNFTWDSSEEKLTITGTNGTTALDVADGNLVVADNIDCEGDIDINGTSNLDIVDIDGAVDMASTLGVTGVVTANAGVVVDNITIDGTEIDLSSGDLTLDVAGNIILDADGGDIKLSDGGTETLRYSNSGSGPQFYSPVSDKDIIFKGNDGGSTITALTLDMSAAGAATFNSEATFAGPLNVTNGESVFSTAQTWGTALELINTNDDVGPAILRLQKTPASGYSTMADGDYIGGLVFRGLNDNSGTQNHNYVENWVVATDVSDGNESSRWSIGTWASGTEKAYTLVANAGKVGLNTASPSYQYHAVNASNDWQHYNQATASSGNVLMHYWVNTGSAPDNKTSKFLHCEDSSAARFIVYSDGDILADAQSIDSDERLKENIVDATSKLDDINRLKVRNFNFRENDAETGQNLRSEESASRKRIGFIAQEFEEIFPSLVGESEYCSAREAVEAKDAVLDDDGNILEQAEAAVSERGELVRKNLRWDALVPILIKAVQELSAKVTALENA